MLLHGKSYASAWAKLSSWHGKAVLSRGEGAPSWACYRTHRRCYALTKCEARLKETWRKVIRGNKKRHPLRMPFCAPSWA